MIEFLQSNIYSIIVVIILIIVLAILYKNGKKAFVKQVILALVIQAEKNLGSKTGQLKYAEVITNLYSKLPAIVRLLYSSNEISKFIEDAVNIMKKLLSDGANLTGYDEERYIEGTFVNTVDNNK